MTIDEILLSVSRSRSRDEYDDALSHAHLPEDRYAWHLYVAGWVDGIFYHPITPTVEQS